MKNSLLGAVVVAKQVKLLLRKLTFHNGGHEIQSGFCF